MYVMITQRRRVCVCVGVGARPAVVDVVVDQRADGGRGVGQGAQEGGHGPVPARADLHGRSQGAPRHDAQLRRAGHPARHLRQPKVITPYCIRYTSLTTITKPETQHNLGNDIGEEEILF